MFLLNFILYFNEEKQHGLKMSRILFFIFVLLLLIFLPQYSFTQTSKSEKIENLEKLVDVTSEVEFRFALEEYVQSLFVNYGVEEIPQEYFLINLMSLINKEYSRRLENPDKARNNYFAELKGMLDEIQVLKQRLRSSGINELKGFISDLEARIKFTINSSDINFKKKKVFEDALQMLLVAEEMIKLDQLQQPEQKGNIGERISKSKKDLLTAFGEVPSAELPVSGKRHTIYDLFEEWKKLDQTTYSLRLTDVKLARQNLIKATDAEGILRMLNDELKIAYEYFNNEQYDQAERLFNDVLEFYPEWGVKNLDDVYFYQAESNFALDRLVRSQEIFEEILQDYPTTSFLPEIYKRLVQINYTFEKFAKTVEYANLYQNVSSPSDAEYFDVQFLAAMASYQQGDLSRTIDILSSIPKKHPYYYLSLYFTANAYVESQRYDEAIAIYLQLADDKNISPTLNNRSLYKIGILEFERKNYFATIEYLSKIPESYVGYDKVLNALAWANFEFEQSKPVGEPKDFSQTQYFADRLINEYYASPYKMEAKSLLAFLSQLENKPSAAMNLYRNIYQTKTTKSKVDDYLDERTNFDKLYQDAKELKELAFQKGDKEQYLKALKIMDQLEEGMMEMDLTEISGLGLNTYSELNALIAQLDELSELRQTALAKEDFNAVRRIDSLQAHLAIVLDRFPPELIKSARRINVFDEYPVSKLISEDENRKKQFADMRLEINEEMNHLEGIVTDLDNSIQEAKASNDFDKVSRLEIKQQKFKELLKDNDNLLSATYMFEPSDYAYPDFNKWGDFGAFGIINVQFFQRQQMQNQISRIALSLDKVNEDLDHRKQVIENKIKKIESEIRFMTMKARVAERTRLRAERERAFREGYFDTRTSEVEQQ